MAARGARPDPRAREDARGAARGLGRAARSGRVRPLSRGRRRRDRRAARAQRQAARAAQVLASAVRSSRRGGARRRSSRSTTISAAYIPDEVLLPLAHRGRGGQGRVAVASGAGARGERCWSPQRGPRAQAHRAGAEERGLVVRHAAQQGARTPRRRWTSCSSGSASKRCRGASSASTSRTSRAPRRSPRWWCSSTVSRPRREYRTSRSRARPTTTSPRCTRCCRAASAAQEREENETAGWVLPDLLVIDGGKGQLAHRAGGAARRADRPRR